MPAYPCQVLFVSPYNCVYFRVMNDRAPYTIRGISYSSLSSLSPVWTAMGKESQLLDAARDGNLPKVEVSFFSVVGVQCLAVVSLSD